MAVLLHLTLPGRNCMTKKLFFYFLFFVVLFVGFYFGLKQAIPGFSDVKLPVLSYVQPFSFTNQEGRHITEKNTAGKVYIAEYFFTTCKGICPKMNSNMKKIYGRFKDEKDFLILSHTVDPQRDSVGRMKRYADSLGVASGNWWFLTGKKDSLYLAARVSYLLDDPKNGNDKIEDQFIHTQFFALVDKNGRVRKIYDGLKNEELDELATDIPRLLNEKTNSSSFANSIFGNNPN
jgi:protein SCO1